MEVTPNDGSVCSSSGCEMPSWLVSIHKRNDANMASRESMMPSPFPPFLGSSNTASAAKPFGVVEGGCGVKLPNSCLPFWTSPSAPGRARNALFEPEAVQPIWIAVPVPAMSKRTPLAALVRWNPFPLTSRIIGLPPQQQGSGVFGSQAQYGRGHTGGGGELLAVHIPPEHVSPLTQQSEAVPHDSPVREQDPHVPLELQMHP